MTVFASGCCSVRIRVLNSHVPDDTVCDLAVATDTSASTKQMELYQNGQFLSCTFELPSPPEKLQYRVRSPDGQEPGWDDIVRQVVLFQDPRQIPTHHTKEARIFVDICFAYGRSDSSVSIYVPSPSVPDESALALARRRREFHQRALASIKELRAEKDRLIDHVKNMSLSLFSEDFARQMMARVSRMQSEKVIRDLRQEINELKGKVRVVVRMRPLIPGEAEAINYEVSGSSSISICERGLPPEFSRDFEFDDAFDHTATNAVVYDRSRVRSVVESAVLIANNVCIFCYGQTNSGKSHTMIGSPFEKGIVEQALDSVFALLYKLDAHKSVYFEMSEIYRENIFRLIEPTQAHSKLDVLEVFHDKIRTRATASTGLNAASSRSHCIFTLTLTDLDSGHSNSIFLVDLAGSERTKISGAEGDRMAEANAINKSLSTLGLVLNGLLNKRAFIPYRDSKLTKLLSPVFAATDPPSKVVMIANVSSHIADERETLSTLAFAQRVGHIELRDRHHTNGGTRTDVDAQISERVERLNTLVINSQSTTDRPLSYHSVTSASSSIKPLSSSRR